MVHGRAPFEAFTFLNLILKIEKLKQKYVKFVIFIYINIFKAIQNIDIIQFNSMIKMKVFLLKKKEIWKEIF